MDINFDKIKISLGIFITTVSALVSIFIAGKIISIHHLCHLGNLKISRPELQ